MGYTTDFAGQVSVVPPLNLAEIAYLRKFSETRRMARTNGTIDAQGEDPEDRWRLIVTDNQVSRIDAVTTWPEVLT